MGDRTRAVLVVALFSFGGLADACDHRVAARPKPPEQLRWILAAEANDEDPFCIPSPREVGTDNGDAFPLRCTSVGDIRRYVRAHRDAP